MGQEARPANQSSKTCLFENVYKTISFELNQTETLMDYEMTHRKTRHTDAMSLEPRNFPQVPK